MFQRKPSQQISLRSHTSATSKVLSAKTSSENVVIAQSKVKGAVLKSSTTSTSTKRSALTDVSNQVGVTGKATDNNNKKQPKLGPTVKAKSTSTALRRRTSTSNSTAITNKGKSNKIDINNRASSKSVANIKRSEPDVAKKAVSTKRQKTDDMVIVEPVQEVEVADDLDKDDEDDPMMLSTYVVEIFEYLFELEKKTLPDCNYMLKQKDLKWKMRSILVDWLVEVHAKFKLLPETLFLTVNIIDRFLSLRSVQFAKLQLVGITALFIASKYEEVYAPSISQFVYMTDGGFIEEELIKAERCILSTLQFQLQFPNHLNFLRRVSKADGYDLLTRTTGKYLMEITLIDETFIKYPPSIVAAAAMYIARHIYGKMGWGANLVKYSGYKESELKECVNHMINNLHKELPYDSVSNKYSTEKNLRASDEVSEWLDVCSTNRCFDMPWM